jgi:hypothetical protein
MVSPSFPCSWLVQSFRPLLLHQGKFRHFRGIHGRKSHWLCRALLRLGRSVSLLERGPWSTLTREQGLNLQMPLSFFFFFLADFSRETDALRFFWGWGILVCFSERACCVARAWGGFAWVSGAFTFVWYRVDGVDDPMERGWCPRRLFWVFALSLRLVQSVLRSIVDSRRRGSLWIGGYYQY